MSVAAYGQWPVVLDEGKLRVVLRDGKSVVVLPVSNNAAAASRATLELL
ncbi:MAG: hypothetical protein K2X03_18715 [Bryobacteraceae bacterium]|nr:hypothetical protein [Bryobacteraceae bacterium]